MSFGKVTGDKHVFLILSVILTVCLLSFAFILLEIIKPVAHFSVQNILEAILFLETFSLHENIACV